MKIRAGFVSNSSSSSFICCLTGNMESGYDASASELGFVECQNGHMFVENLKLDSDKEVSVDEYRQWLKNSWQAKSDYYKKEIEENLALDDEEFLEYFEEEWEESFNEDGINPLFCPVCQLEDLPDEDVAKYFLVQVGLSRKEFAKQMKEKFGDYNNFSEFLKGLKK